MGELRLSGCSVDLGRGLVRADDGDERWLTSLETALLRYLVERPGEDVARDDLVREVWRGMGAGRVVDFTVGRLRRKLGEPKRPNHVLTAHGHGYRFVPLIVAEQVTQAPPTDVVVALATGVLHLGRQRFVRDGQPISLSRIEARLLEQLVAEIDRPVPRSTLIARIWGRGDHDNALDAAISRLRLKLERDPAEPTVLVTARGLGPRLVPHTEARGHLPSAGSSYVDRPERTRILEALQHHRLVTVLGPAGIGKTRLAREVGWTWLRDRPSAEVWFCDLTRASGAERMVARVSVALGGQNTTDPAGVARMLAARPAGSLVVLDNFEQLVSDAAILVVAGWLQQSGVHVLTTSRIPLGLSGEVCVPVEPLDAAAGTRLFLERAPPHEADLPSVRALVERLDGLPLAIELAAALADRLAPAEVLQRIGSRLDLLVIRPEGATSQHSTLRGAIDWSWHLLDDAQRSALAACSVFVSPFDASAATAVLGSPCTPVLDALVARSLVRSVQGQWVLSESVRDYARERLLLGDGHDEAVERHAEHFAARAEPLTEDLGGPWGTEARIDLTRIREELLSALESTRRPELRGRIGRVLSERGFPNESHAALHQRLTRALERGVDAENEPYLWLDLANCSGNEGLRERAEAEIARAVDRARSDPALQVAVAMARVRLALVNKEGEAAVAWLDVAEQVLETMPRSRWRFRQQVFVAVFRLPPITQVVKVGDPARRLASALALAEELGDAYLQGIVLRNAARIHEQKGDTDAALAWSDRALALAQRTGRVDDELMARITQATTLFEAGDFQSAERSVDTYEALGRSSGRRHEDVVAITRSWIAFERREFDAALRLVDGSEPRSRADHTYNRAACAAALSAVGRLEEAVRRLASVVAPHPIVRLQLAAALAEVGRHDEAARLFAGARGAELGVWGFERTAHLVETHLALERARGTEGWTRACEDAQGVLDAATRVRCEDGELRERPGNASRARILLECALARTGGARQSQALTQLVRSTRNR